MKFKNKIRRVALKVTTNIDTLIKDLFHNPPSYKSLVHLSWKLTEVIILLHIIIYYSAIKISNQNNCNQLVKINGCTFSIQISYINFIFDIIPFLVTK